MADEARPFKTITLGNLLSAVPAIIMLFSFVIWATTQGNINAQQSVDIVRIDKDSFTKDAAAAGRQLRDAQITGLQNSITVVQSGITATLGILSARMDRAFQRLDDLQNTVTKLDTIVSLMQRQARVGNREFDSRADSVSPGTSR